MIAPEIYIFGSLVRCEVDPGSDVDVLVIVGRKEKMRFPNEWSVYSRARIKSLFGRGTLFAWHLYSEAVPIFTRKKMGFLEQLGRPVPYTGGYEEVLSLRSILDGAINELRWRTPTPTYELGLVVMACRDIAMAAIPTLQRRFAFTRMAPFLIKSPRFPIAKQTYNLLCECRRATTRGLKSPLSSDTLEKCLHRLPSLRRWAMNIQEVLHEGVSKEGRSRASIIARNK